MTGHKSAVEETFISRAGYVPGIICENVIKQGFILSKQYLCFGDTVHF
jgi:hypothetical protein